MSSLIKKINRYVKHLLLRKTDVLKTSILKKRKKIGRNALHLKSKKVYWRKRLFLAFSFSAVLRLQNLISDFF